jgi:hypothetical protein
MKKQSLFEKNVASDGHRSKIRSSSGRPEKNRAKADLVRLERQNTQKLV